MRIVLARQAVGLHKASGLDWHQPHGARAVGPCGVGCECVDGGPRKRANYTRPEWPPAGPISLISCFPQATQVFDLCALGLQYSRPAGLVLVIRPA